MLQGAALSPAVNQLRMSKRLLRPWWISVAAVESAVLLAAKLILWSPVHGFHYGIPSIVDSGLRRVPLCFASAHRLADQLPCYLLRVTLDVCCGGVRISSAVIFSRLGCAARNKEQNNELTQLEVGHQNLQAQIAEHPTRWVDLPRIRIKGQHCRRRSRAEIFESLVRGTASFGGLAYLSR